jgi:hypothetical protein
LDDAERLGHTAERWQRVRVDGVLELSIPPTMSTSEARAIESPAGVWEGKGISVVVDASMYADDLGSAPGVATTDRIDGRPVRIVSQREGDGTRLVAAHFPSSQPPEASRCAGVTIVVRATPTIPADIPLRIIRSVKAL